MTPSWEQTWMTVAYVVAQRSRCVRAKVGAVVVDSRQRVVATGYNNPPAGMRTEGECAGWCPRAQASLLCPGYSDCLSVHAEANAIAYADRARMDAGTLYVTRAVCIQCAKLVANCGLCRVVMCLTEQDNHLDPASTARFLESSGLVVEYGVAASQCVVPSLSWKD